MSDFNPEYIKQMQVELFAANAIIAQRDAENDAIKKDVEFYCDQAHQLRQQLAQRDATILEMQSGDGADAETFAKIQEFRATILAQQAILNELVEWDKDYPQGRFYNIENFARNESRLDGIVAGAEQFDLSALAEHDLEVKRKVLEEAAECLDGSRAFNFIAQDNISKGYLNAAEELRYMAAELKGV